LRRSTAASTPEPDGLQLPGERRTGAATGREQHTQRLARPVQHVAQAAGFDLPAEVVLDHIVHDWSRDEKKLLRSSPNGLTCDYWVTYCVEHVDDDAVFRALADSTRRYLLDRLFERDGRTLTELESDLAMTRFGVMKHLRVLEAAGLVVTRRSGREKHHFLNPVPIRLIHDRWIDKYTERHAAALADLKHELEETG
jgi:DNA-binding transcriptional ArsR family regulator